MARELPAAFDLEGRVAAVTGGAGMLGREHALALFETGATVALLDVDGQGLADAVEQVTGESRGNALAIEVDITDQGAVRAAFAELVARAGRIDVLVNNAAIDPKVESPALSRLESFPVEQWERELAVGLTGAFHCSREAGGWMAGHDGGAIVNVASDLAVIAPDQRLYRQEGLAEAEQPVKPVTYSVIKSGLLGLTRYLATYWADRGVRVNAISPGGVQAGQPEEFVARLSDRIPMGRMARHDEYRSAIQFLSSDASSYMTGQNLVLDGGRTVW